MKKLLMSALMLVSAIAYGQKPMQTLLDGKGTPRVTGHGGITAKLTRFDGETALLSGLFGGAVFNERLFVGAGAYGLSNNIYVPNQRNAIGQKLRWNMNYGGLMLGFIAGNRNAVHLTGGVLAGAGYLHKSWSGGTVPEDIEDQYDDNIDGSTFFVAEPHLEVEVNLLRWMRLGLGGSYRYISGSDSRDITDRRLSAPAGHISFKFGRF